MAEVQCVSEILRSYVSGFKGLNVAFFGKDTYGWQFKTCSCPLVDILG